MVTIPRKDLTTYLDITSHTLAMTTAELVATGEFDATRTDTGQRIYQFAMVRFVAEYQRPYYKSKLVLESNLGKMWFYLYLI